MSSYRPALSFIVFTFFTVTSLEAQENLNTWSFRSPAELKRFLSFSEGKSPLIAGHRGTVEDGFPENSIEGFEHVLKHTPAIFEIDPRLTKDSVIVLMHDATLDRTTTAKGEIKNFTWKELQALFLKDADGNPTRYKIPTLEAVFSWAIGKTIVNLDHKGVPFEMIADLIDRQKAWNHVMITTHSPEQARFYLDRNRDQFFSAHIKTPETFRAYENAGIPFDQMIAYIGPSVKESNREMYRLLNGKGALAMISSASTYDKLPDPEERKKAYLTIIKDGAGVLESDYPIEVSRALQELSR